MRLGDLDALKNAKPEFMNEKVVRDTKYRTTKDRIYANAWNACNSCWIDTIDNAPTVEERSYKQGFRDGYAQCITDNEERKESNRLFQKGGAE